MRQAFNFTDTGSDNSASNAHLIDNSPEILQQINQTGVNLSLWKRSAKQQIAEEIYFLKPSDLPDVRSDTSQVTFDGDVIKLLKQQGLDPLAFHHWRADLRKLADIFFSVIGGRNTSMRLEATEHVHCPRFHVDRTHLRLLCTYQGPSTEWLSNAQTDRDAQRNAGLNEEIVRFGEPSNFGLFSVGVMKGDAYPGNTGNGLVHRSPPVRATDRTRVLFCLDS